MVYSLMNTCVCTMYVDVWRLTCVVVFFILLLMQGTATQCKSLVSLPILLTQEIYM